MPEIINWNDKYFFLNLVVKGAMRIMFGLHCRSTSTGLVKRGPLPSSSEPILMPRLHQ